MKPEQPSAKEFAETMINRRIAEMTAARELVEQNITLDEINKNRIEILNAFTAKYGFDPDHAAQIIGRTKDGCASSWTIIHISDAQIKEARKKHLADRINSSVSEQLPLNLWQKLCFFAATGRWQS